MITKEQAEQIKEMALTFACALAQYHDTPLKALAEKRQAWDAMKGHEKALESFVDGLAKEATPCQ